MGPRCGHYLGYLLCCTAIYRLLRHLILAANVAGGWFFLPYNYHRKRISDMLYEACIDQAAQ